METIDIAVIGGAVVRQEKAYPVYDETYARNVAAIAPFIASKNSVPPMSSRMTSASVIIK